MKARKDMRHGAAPMWLDAPRGGAIAQRMDRKHSFESLHNFRDFGGYSAGGRMLVTGRLFRSANHALATDADLARLSGMGIGAIVDLRRPDERQRQPSRRWDGFSGLLVENHDDDEGSSHESWDGFMAQWDMTPEHFRTYILGYYARAPYMPRLLDLFSKYFDTLSKVEGGLIVHCAAGKDRTGLIVALTHALAGVHRDDIIEDYLLTNDSERFKTYGAQWAQMIGEQRGRAPTLDTMQYVMGVQAEFLERSFAEVEARSGSVEVYLRDVLGVTRERREAIEQRLFG
jgi:protein-tyrosine phosphatase